MSTFVRSSRLRSDMSKPPVRSLLRPFSYLQGMTLIEVTGLKKESKKVLLKTQCGRLFRIYRTTGEVSCGSMALEDFKIHGQLFGEIFSAEEDIEWHQDYDDDDDDDSYGTLVSRQAFALRTSLGELSMTWLGLGAYSNLCLADFCEIFEEYDVLLPAHGDSWDAFDQNLRRYTRVASGSEKRAAQVFVGTLDTQGDQCVEVWVRRADSDCGAEMFHVEC